MSATMSWRDALRAMAFDAARRAENSVPMKSGPNDPVTVAERAGARYAFGVMAQELEYLAHRHTSSREAIAKLRRLLAQAEARTGEQPHDPEQPTEKRDAPELGGLRVGSESVGESSDDHH